MTIVYLGAEDGRGGGGGSLAASADRAANKGALGTPLEFTMVSPGRFCDCCSGANRECIKLRYYDASCVGFM